MNDSTRIAHWARFPATIVAICLAIVSPVHADDGPGPLLAAGQPVDWWFVFKFNGKDFPGCGPAEERVCLFDAGMTPPSYRGGFGQQFVYASSAASGLVKGSGCVGETLADPLGATFGRVFDGDYYYVVWNDQPYGHPSIAGCGAGDNCDAPWGHSKGLLAWNDAGDGLVMQVTTPSWPLSASKGAPRDGDANTLGCVADDDVKLSQHFFAVKLDKGDLVVVLEALQNASVGTDPAQPQLIRNGGPPEVQALVARLGTRSDSKIATRRALSSGVGLISKPSHLDVPPWQLVSAELGGVPLRTATFWNAPKIPGTTAATPIGCWDDSLTARGAVEIAEIGHWQDTLLELGSGGNHAKIGVSTNVDFPFVIFGDENQQGVLDGDCNRSQNGRGGLFFVLRDEILAGEIRSLLSAPPQGVAKAARR